jgi:hypothetical protein
MSEEESGWLHDKPECAENRNKGCAQSSTAGSAGEVGTQMSHPFR